MQEMQGPQGTYASHLLEMGAHVWVRVERLDRTCVRVTLIPCTLYLSEMILVYGNTPEEAMETAYGLFILREHGAWVVVSCDQRVGWIAYMVDTREERRGPASVSTLTPAPLLATQTA